MFNLAVDICEKMEAAGFEAKAVCERAGVSPSTVTLLKRKGNCSQRTYDNLLVALQDMAKERKEKMEKTGFPN